MKIDGKELKESLQEYYRIVEDRKMEQILDRRMFIEAKLNNPQIRGFCVECEKYLTENCCLINSPKCDKSFMNLIEIHENEQIKYRIEIKF